MTSKVYKVVAAFILFFILIIGLSYTEKIVTRQIEFNERDAAISTVNGGDSAVMVQIASTQNVKLVKGGYLSAYFIIGVLTGCAVGSILFKKETETVTKEEVK